MLAVAFYALYRSPALQPVTTTLWQLGLFMISVVGIAGFGHVFLDAFDVAEDRAAGKPNLWDNASSGARAALVTVLLAASWLPWTMLPNTRTGLVLIALEWFVLLIVAFTTSGALAGVGAIVIGSIAAFIAVIFLRVWLELIVVIFRIGENTSKLVEQRGGTPAA